MKHINDKSLSVKNNPENAKALKIRVNAEARNSYVRYAIPSTLQSMITKYRVRKKKVDKDG